MTPRILTIALLPAVLVIAACEDGIPRQLPGGGPGGGVATVASYNGLWSGAYVGSPPGDPLQWASTFTAIFHDGRMVLVESNGQVWEADFAPTGAATMRANDVLVYGSNGIQVTRVVINGSIAGTDTLSLSYDLGTGVGLIQMQFGDDAAYTRGSSLSLLSDIWSVAADETTGTLALALSIIDVDGQALFDGADSRGCQYNGVIELIDADRNLYEIPELVVTDGVAGACDVITTINITDNEAPGGSRTEEVINPFAGDDYAGFATLVPDQDTLLLVATNGSSRAINLLLERN